MTKKIATLVATVAIAGALFAAPALARDNDGHRNGRWRAGQEWREHHPYQGYGNQNWGYGGYGYGYPYSGQGYGYQSGRYAYGYPYSGYRGYPRQGWNSARGWHHDNDHDRD